MWAFSKTTPAEEMIDDLRLFSRVAKQKFGLSSLSRTLPILVQTATMIVIARAVPLVAEEVIEPLQSRPSPSTAV
jgi:hypothetical protein